MRENRSPLFPRPLLFLVCAAGVSALPYGAVWVLTATVQIPIATPAVLFAGTWLLLRRSRQRRLGETSRLQRQLHLSNRDVQRLKLTVGVLTAARFSAADAHQLIGHAEREGALEYLGERYYTGHLTRPEFDSRTAQAAAARTRSQLARALHRLP